MIKHTIPATNTMNNKEIALEVVTAGTEGHTELRLTGNLKPIRVGGDGQDTLALAIDNESAAALARAMGVTVPSIRRGR